jgi:uncharacterized membrane protein
MEQSIFQSDERTVKIGMTERVISAVTGGTLLGYGLYTSSKLRIPILLLGGAMLARGLSGYSLFYRMLNIYRSKDAIENGIRVERAVTIGRPVEEVYAFWRDLENLPRFMENLYSVSESEGRSHWVAEAPLGQSVEWDAVIEDEELNEKISWRSLPESQIENAGTVLFKPAPGDRGTEVHVRLEYRAPGGSAGAALAKLLGEEPDIQIREDLRRLKMILETGQVMTVKGQPTGRGRQKVAW